MKKCRLIFLVAALTFTSSQLSFFTSRGDRLFSHKRRHVIEKILLLIHDKAELAKFVEKITTNKLERRKLILDAILYAKMLGGSNQFNPIDIVNLEELYKELVNSIFERHPFMTAVIAVAGLNCGIYILNRVGEVSLGALLQAVSNWAKDAITSK